MQVFLPGKFYEWKNLVGYDPWGHKESDMTEHVHTHTHAHTHLQDGLELLTLPCVMNTFGKMLECQLVQ